MTPSARAAKLGHAAHARVRRKLRDHPSAAATDRRPRRRALPPHTLRAEPAGRITGVGGIFVTSKDPKALAAWYKTVIGIKLEPWGGAILRTDAPGHPPMALWNAMPTNSEEIAPSHRDFMINFAVDDLDAYAARLEANHVKILDRQSDKTGKFAWILDPDGTKIELWQPHP